MNTHPNTLERQGLIAMCLRLHLDSPAVITMVAFLLRVLLILALGTYRLPTGFGFAYEIGNVARSVAEGHGFSSPYPDPSGPTALVSPIYASLLAGIFKILGVYSNASALTAMVLDSLCSSLTCWTIFILARETFDRRVAILAAWFWAFSPTAIHASVNYIWETCVSTLLLTVVLILTVRLSHRAKIVDWLRYGALWAFLVLTNGAVLAIFPFLLVWLFVRSNQRAPQRFAGVLIAGLVFAIGTSPWVIRNDIVFGSPMLRSGFGPTIYGGMLLEEEAGRMYNIILTPPEQKLYRELGESQYMAVRRRDAIQLIAARPWDLVRLSFKRCLLFWFGDWYRLMILQPGGISVVVSLAVFGSIAVAGLPSLFLAFWRRSPYASMYAIPLLTFPILYYVTHVEARYRHPMEPILITLIAFAIVTIFGSAREYGEISATGLDEIRA